jgi:hypothetical protein
MRALLLVTVWIASNVLAPFSISSTGYESIEARGVEEVLVAVLDTGIDRNHQELVGRVTAEVNFLIVRMLTTCTATVLMLPGS